MLAQFDGRRVVPGDYERDCGRGAVRREGQAPRVRTSSTHTARLPAHIRRELSQARRERVSFAEVLGSFHAGDDAPICQLDDGGFTGGA
jgi:hypothetical protein